MTAAGKKKGPPLLPPEAHGRPVFSPLWELPDPTISKDGDWYYVYATGQGIEARRSRDLIDWEVLPPVFSDSVPAWAKKKIPGADSIWAPDIRKIGNRWHLHYSVSTLGSQHSVLGLAIAESLDPAHPKGGWKDHGLVLESQPGKDSYNALDSSVCLDETGRPWIVWGSYFSGIFLAEADPTTGKLAQGARHHHVANRLPGIGQNGNHTQGIEGPVIIRKHGRYYLFVSLGDQINYHVVVGRADHITGPYVDRMGKPLIGDGGTPVIAPYGRNRGNGHNGVLVDECPWFDIFVNHTLMETSRDLQVRPMFWSEDGWPLVGEVLTRPHELRDPKMEGTWIHQVAWQDAPSVEFCKDGSLRDRRGAQGRWECHGRILHVHWSSGQTEKCFVHPDGDSYVGRDERDADVRGWRI
jgi:arabinan endo-1,5-alpha-L-arabinosidase